MRIMSATTMNIVGDLKQKHLPAYNDIINIFGMTSITLSKYAYIHWYLNMTSKKFQWTQLPINNCV